MTAALQRYFTGQRLFLSALLIVFAFASIQYSFKAARGKSAINRWAPQLQQMETGEDIHRQFNYPNPPIMALMLWPVSELITIHPLAGALSWFYLKVALAVLCVFWVFQLIETPESPFPPWAKALTVALSLRPILGDLSHGNVNIFILFLVVASLRAFSRGRDFLAGLLLALAIACKVTPALFVAYFIWKRAGRVLLGCGAGLVLSFLLVPALFLGWSLNLQALSSWIDVMIRPYLMGGIVWSEHNNQSLPGLIARMLTVAPSFSGDSGGTLIPLRYDNIASVGAETAKWLVRGCMALFALLVVMRCRAPIAAPGQSPAEVRRGWRLAAEYALICLGMLLFSERTWKHHCVTLLLPFAVLCYGLASIEWSRDTKRALSIIVAVAILMMATTSSGISGDTSPNTATPVPEGVRNNINMDAFAKQAQVYGAYVWAFIFLIGGLMVQLTRALPIAARTASDWKFPAYDILYRERTEREPEEVARPRRRARRRRRKDA